MEHGNDRLSGIVDAHDVHMSTGSIHLIASSEYLLLLQIPPPSWIEASLAVEAVVKLSFE